MDKIHDLMDRYFFHFVAIALFGFTGLATFSIIRIDTLMNQCADENGIVVKTPDGWKCLVIEEIRGIRYYKEN